MSERFYGGTLNRAIAKLWNPLGFTTLTPEEASAALNAAPRILLPKERIDEIVRFAIESRLARAQGPTCGQPEKYHLPNGDTIKLADVDYIKYRLSRMTDATSTLDRPILVVGLKSEPIIEGTYVEIHLKFDSDDAVINAYYALDSAVRAYRKSQPSQDPLDRP